ncbi:HET-domain-containing protein, partial [Lepidopterella palustris CBS 459.81]
RYVTLSHCWGPPTKRPLRTTTSNISQHLQEIPWHALPPTFQDAITLCAEVGIQYLWIDSLCIVQDDVADWAEESVKMGRIYEEAHFTIAASSASDSSQAHSVFAYIEPELEKDLSGAPLNDRAWVMQEYYLSRRTVHFTQNGLIWTCKDQMVPTRRYITSEFGDFWVKAFEHDWSALVSSYSKRQMTYKSDKLVALQGLEELFRERDNKTYCYGLWLEDLPQDLLWYSND